MQNSSLNLASSLDSLTTAFRERDVLRRLWAHSDSRVSRDAKGLDAYGCASVARASTIALGSCTASSPTVQALRQSLTDCASIDKWGHDRFAATIRVRISEALKLDQAEIDCDVVLTPSGTDAELILAWLSAVRAEGPVTTILLGAAERGSGTALAAAGRHFSALLPNGTRCVTGDPVDASEWPTVIAIKHRSETGDLLPRDVLGAAVEDARTNALKSGSTPLIHDVFHGKTGWTSVSNFADGFTTTDDNRVLRALDAAQGRISHSTLHAALRSGRIVIVTGSKFWGGPPFCGALLVPKSWRDSARRATLSPGLKPYFGAALLPPEWTAARASASSLHVEGVLLRWSAALAEFESIAHYSTAEISRAINHFATVVTATLSGDERVSMLGESTTVFDAECPWEQQRTVFGFELRDGQTVSLSKARRALEQMHEEHGGWHLGQPVQLAANRVMFRVALGVPLLHEMLRSTRHGGVESCSDGSDAIGSLRLPRMIERLCQTLSSLGDAP